MALVVIVFRKEAEKDGEKIYSKDPWVGNQTPYSSVIAFLYGVPALLLHYVSSQHDVVSKDFTSVLHLFLL